MFNLFKNAYWSNKNSKVYLGSALEVLKTFPDNSIDMCCTSPPYWALRDYQLEPIIWDGNEKCQHLWGKVIAQRTDETGFERNRKGLNKAAEMINGNPRIATTDNPAVKRESQFCSLCGAWRGELGLEPTFELYLKHLWQIFDEIKRVLKKTGTCWVDMGDTYSGNKIGKTDKKCSEHVKGSQDKLIKKAIIQEKTLCLIPFRFSIEMVNRGWILRNTIIWYKRNCMPSSVKDRFTVDYELVFFLVKNKKYWFEQQFIPYAPSSDVRYRQKLRQGKQYNLKEPYKQNMPYHSIKRRGNNSDGLCLGGPKMPPIGGVKKAGGNNLTYSGNQPEWSKGRNMRCVWDIPTQPFKGAHFAVYPEELCIKPILAGCPPGGIVIDPFCGSGTTGIAAQKLGRKFIGIDLSKDYLDQIAIPRLKNEEGLF